MGFNSTNVLFDANCRDELMYRYIVFLQVE